MRGYCYAECPSSTPLGWFYGTCKSDKSDGTQIRDVSSVEKFRCFNERAISVKKRMRCSTNIYLTALAVADIIYLLFVFVLSFSVYDNINDRKYELFWRFFGLTHWLCDAASNASVWLTVSFTLERYIAVCHPIKGKVLCTENRAKIIITGIAIFCILSTLSTTFEYELAMKEKCVRNCTQEELKNRQHVPDGSVRNNSEVSKDRTDHAHLVPTGKLITNDTSDNDTCCLKKFTVSTVLTNLGKNKNYKIFISWFPALCFALIPLILIATFNCFLVHAVYKSQSRRRKMTNSQETVSMSNENRITVMLIGVVFLFLICQTPTASFLIYSNFYEAEDLATENIHRALGNIFNFLVNINAATNFIMYCILSKKYRTTFRTLFCGRRKNRQDTLILTDTRTRYSSFNNGLRRNVSEYHTPRNLETQSLTSIPRSKSLMTRPPGKAKSSDINL
nr:PREDICTED: thyrotropin-releasing hormone receptor isoform X5 [Tribolium castaneum]|eukprot:XP_015833251.1 PREDICTED: thyrotropin-releasing hormone receptor isoform X5 [Tribolium castaneum]